MYKTHSIVFAFALALGACGDQTVDPITGPLPPPPTATARATLRGIVVLGDDGAPAALEIEGMRVGVEGEGADEMQNVPGADVLAIGMWDKDDGKLIVESFEVLMMGGRAAYDGVLELHDQAYAVRLSNNRLHWLSDPPAALTEHVGTRIWFTESAGIAPASFGVISFAESRVNRQLR